MISMRVSGDDLLLKRLERVKLTPQRRKNLVGRLGRKVESAARQRITRKLTLSGAPMAPKAAGKKARPWKGIKRSLRTRRIGNDTAEVSFKTPFAGRVAGQLQAGATQRVTAAALKKKDGGKPATKLQAKALKAENKGFRKMSVKAIQAKYSRGQAGRILRAVRDEPAKKSWTVRLPARPFLGITEGERSELVGMVRAEVAKGVSA